MDTDTSWRHRHAIRSRRRVPSAAEDTSRRCHGPHGRYLTCPACYCISGIRSGRRDRVTRSGWHGEGQRGAGAGPGPVHIGSGIGIAAHARCDRKVLQAAGAALRTAREHCHRRPPRSTVLREPQLMEVAHRSEDGEVRKEGRKEHGIWGVEKDLPSRGAAEEEHGLAEYHGHVAVSRERSGSLCDQTSPRRRGEVEYMRVLQCVVVRLYGSCVSGRGKEVPASVCFRRGRHAISSAN